MFVWVVTMPSAVKIVLVSDGSRLSSTNERRYLMVTASPPGESCTSSVAVSLAAAPSTLLTVTT